MWKKLLSQSSLQSWLFAWSLSRLRSLFQAIASSRGNKLLRKRSPKNTQMIEWELLPYSFKLEWFLIEDPSGVAHKATRHTRSSLNAGEPSPVSPLEE